MSRYLFISNSLNKKLNPSQFILTSQFVRFKNESYLTTDDRSLLKKQVKFPKLTSQIYVQTKEVKQNDNYSVIEPLLDQSQPHELHLVKKIKSLVGEPWWIKKAMKDLGFEKNFRKEWQTTFNILPNTAEVNDLLMRVKHMVKIIPIKFKNGYPTQDDISHTKLNLETGEMEIHKKIEFALQNNIKVFKINDVSVTSDLQTNSSFPLDKDELLGSIHRQKQLGKLNEEYFPAVYDYKYGQDKPQAIRIKGRPDTSVKEDELV